MWISTKLGPNGTRLGFTGRDIKSLLKSNQEIKERKAMEAEVAATVNEASAQLLEGVKKGFMQDIETYFAEIREVLADVPHGAADDTLRWVSDQEFMIKHGERGRVLWFVFWVFTLFIAYKVGAM